MKSYGWVVVGWLGGGVVAYRIIVSAPVPVPFLWTLDFYLGLRFGTLDLDLGLTIVAIHQEEIVILTKGF